MRLKVPTLRCAGGASLGLARPEVLLAANTRNPSPAPSPAPAQPADKPASEKLRETSLAQLTPTGWQRVQAKVDEEEEEEEEEEEDGRDAAADAAKGKRAEDDDPSSPMAQLYRNLDDVFSYCPFHLRPRDALRVAAALVAGPAVRHEDAVKEHHKRVEARFASGAAEGEGSSTALPDGVLSRFGLTGTQLKMRVEMLGFGLEFQVPSSVLEKVEKAYLPRDDPRVLPARKLALLLALVSLRWQDEFLPAEEVEAAAALDAIKRVVSHAAAPCLWRWCISVRMHLRLSCSLPSTSPVLLLTMQRADMPRPRRGAGATGFIALRDHLFPAIWSTALRRMCTSQFAADAHAQSARQSANSYTLTGIRSAHQSSNSRLIMCHLPPLPTRRTPLAGATQVHGSPATHHAVRKRNRRGRPAAYGRLRARRGAPAAVRAPGRAGAGGPVRRAAAAGPVLNPRAHTNRHGRAAAAARCDAPGRCITHEVAVQGTNGWRAHSHATSGTWAERNGTC